VIDVERAANTLRAWALDKDLKRLVLASPALAAMAARVAMRYTAGETIEAISAGRASVARGHVCSIEYAGESVREAELARSETQVFLDLAAVVRDEGLPVQRLIRPVARGRRRWTATWRWSTAAGSRRRPPHSAHP